MLNCQTMIFASKNVMLNKGMAFFWFVHWRV
jgi:hypothetical protein